MTKQHCSLLSPSMRLPSPRGGGGGGTLIFSYIRRLGTIFWVQNFVFQFLWGGGGGGFRKINIFRCEDFVDIFWGSSQIALYLGVISMHFMVFS